MTQPDFVIEHMAPADLRPHPQNFRRHPAPQRAALAGSLEEHGWLSAPIFNRRTGHLLDGHARVEWAEGREESIPVRVVDVSARQEQRILRAFDQIGAMAEIDDGALEALIEEIGDVDLERLLGELTEPESGLLADADPDAIPEQVETRCKAGDMWTCAHHRILCADSTDAMAINRLMQGKQADLCFTSPPYDRQREYGGDLADWDDLMQGVFTLLPMKDAGQVLVNLGLVHRDGEWQPYWQEWIEWMREIGWRRFGWYVWDQGAGLPGDWNGRLAPSHEFIFHFNREAERARKTVPCIRAGKMRTGPGLRDEDGSQKAYTHGNRPVQSHRVPDSVIRVTRENHATDHPAVFPVRLALEMIEAFSDPGDLAYEPFLGSGTTMIAAEQTARVVYGCEREPGYVDICLARWEQTTGKTAERID